MLGTKFHYGNCQQEYADLRHEYEKQKTKIDALEQTLRDNEQIIIQLNTEIQELKAIHHYEREQLEKKLTQCTPKPPPKQPQTTPKINPKLTALFDRTLYEEPPKANHPKKKRKKV